MFVFCVGQFALQANAGEPPALPECLSENFFQTGIEMKSSI